MVGTSYIIHRSRLKSKGEIICNENNKVPIKAPDPVALSTLPSPHPISESNWMLLMETQRLKAAVD